jgi:hypothetical protein
MSHWKQFRREYRQFLVEGKLQAAKNSLCLAISKMSQMESSNMAEMYNQLAKLHLMLNEPVAAEYAAQQAINSEKQFGPPTIESDHMAAYHVMLAEALAKQGKYSRALTALDKGIELYLQHMKRDDELMVNLNTFRELIKDERWRCSS